MDPFIVLFLVVVVINILCLVLMCKRQIQTCVSSVTAILFPKPTLQHSGIQVQHQHKDNTAQTTDTQHFTAFYDHVQTQRQELLAAKVDFEHIIFNFDNNLANINSSVDENFRRLIAQLQLQLNDFAHNLMTGSPLQLKEPFQLR